MRGWTGLCPRPRWGAYSTPLDPLARLKALLLKGRVEKVVRQFWGESYAPVFSCSLQKSVWPGIEAYS